MLRKLLALFSTGPSAPDFELPSDDQLERTPTGLGVHILEPGQGEQPGPLDEVTVRYAGWLENGKRFDSSFPGTATFPLNRVIPGWTEGLQLLRPGGSAKLVIPHQLGYGPRGMPPRIPPSATLVFHVELVAVK